MNACVILKTRIPHCHNFYESILIVILRVPESIYIYIHKRNGANAINILLAKILFTLVRVHVVTKLRYKNVKIKRKDYVHSKQDFHFNEGSAYNLWASIFFLSQTNLRQYHTNNILFN